MQPSDRDLTARGDIIPFPPRTPKSTGVATTTLAALVAVTVLHDEHISAEEKLLELIEASGEAQVMDSTEALDLLDDPSFLGEGLEALPKPFNDNY